MGPSPSDAGRPQSLALPRVGTSASRQGFRKGRPRPVPSGTLLGAVRLTGPRVADWVPYQRGPTGDEKSSPWVPPASPRLAGFLMGLISVKPLDCVSPSGV